MKFFPMDWRGDANLRLCSLAARGLWIEMCGIMHESDPRGYLMNGGRKMGVEDLASIAGRPLEEVAGALSELESRSVFSRTKTGVIYSRRIV